MPFAHKHFDIDIERHLDLSRLQWPRRGEAGAEGEAGGFGGNMHYQDMRGLRWKAVREVLDNEAALVSRMEAADDADAEFEAIEEELYDEDLLWGLDLGVAGATFAVSAARCIPYTSCNAGAFDKRHHNERHPLVAMNLRPQMVPIFLEAAEAAGAGLYNCYDGACVYGDDVRALMRFGEELYRRRAALNAIRLRARSVRKTQSDIFKS